MSKFVELKDAVDQLEVAVAALADAEREEANWRYSDMHRQDGSRAQDERHERMGREASERVRHASQKVNLQKDLITKLISSI